MSRNINETSVPTIIVSKYDLGDKYIGIGYGSEGSVYNYNNQYAIKTFSLFRAMEYFYKDRVDLKFRKVEEMAKIEDDLICFPKGIVGFRDLFMEGCFYNLIRYNTGRKDFEDLEGLEIDEQIELLSKGNTILKRAHELGLTIGDIKEDNFMIDINGNVILVDVDNCAYKDYSFDLYPDRCDLYEILYGKKCEYKDNDIMLYTLLVLRTIFKNPNFSFGVKKEELDYYINILPVSKEIKDIVQLLLSDAHNKPYVDTLLQKIKR